MLIFTRKKGEKIIIDDLIIIKILNIKKKKIYIGIDAPKKISIYREEIYNILKNKK